MRAGTRAALGLMTAALVLAPGGAAAAVPIPGRVVASVIALPSRALYVEGSLQRIAVQRASDGKLIAAKQGRSPRLDVVAPPGAYVLASATRVCNGNCSELAPPTERCSVRFTLPANTTMRARVLTKVGERCKASVRRHGVNTRGSSRADRAQARGFLRYLRRNAGAAPWFPALRVIDVQARVFVVKTTLVAGRASTRTATTQLCELIQASDYADLTPGHRVIGRQGTLVERCPARRD